MKIQLAGWECKGLRCPDVVLSLLQGDSPSQITLIQMPNGTGKTTTLTMITAALTGVAERWSPDLVKSFRRPEESHDEGHFLLRLQVDGRPLTFEMKLNFAHGYVRYRTTSPGSGGVTTGWKPPEYVRRFLNEKFVDFFVFDGELAAKLLDSNQSEAEKAIDALCQLYLLDRIKQIAEEAWVRATVGRPKTGSGLSMWQNKLTRLQKALKTFERLSQQSQLDLAVVNSDIQSLDKHLNDQLSAQEQAHTELQRRKDEEQAARESVEKSAQKAMELVRLPHLLHPAFAKSLVQLKLSFDRLKLPESSSKQFFFELLEENTCICGRPMDEQSRLAIKTRAGEYLGKETAGTLNTLKQDIELHLIETGNRTHQDLMETSATLKQEVRRFDQARSMFRALTNELVKKGGEELQKKKDELEQKRKRKEDLEVMLEELNRAPREDDDENTNCIKAIEKQVREAKLKVEEITGTVDLGEKTRILQMIADRAQLQARENLRKALIKACNEKLAIVLARDPLVIDNIEKSIHLRHQEGASVGQTLAVGYTFLTTILNRGKDRFPLIVDSPANPLDTNVRREIAALLPELCEQFVGFTISTEREGFIAALHNKCRDRIKYLTIFRKTAGTHRLMEALPLTGVTDTHNGIIVEGKHYFENFDLEKEQ